MAPAKLKNLDLGQNNGEHCFAAAESLMPELRQCFGPTIIAD
jgi:hypothetical protein